MTKRILYFGHEAYLSTSKNQVVVRYPNDESTKTVPMEDVGILVLDHYRLTLTATLLNRLLEHNAAVITCDARHMPLGMFLNLNGNTMQQEYFAYQIGASQALKDRLWKQTVQAKIENQAGLLTWLKTAAANMYYWSSKVKNGDPDNMEARAAAYYWKHLFSNLDFKRERFGVAPNGLLNYGYTILRGVVARSLVGSGLLPTLGIHHHNKYNAYCLADDIMEPYRPFVDQLVLECLSRYGGELTPDNKQSLLSVPMIEVQINQRKSSLMFAVQQTTASLRQVYAGVEKKLKLPHFV